MQDMDRVFKLPVFNRWMKKAELTNQVLVKAIDEIKNGLVDADLGGGLLKKRVPLPGQGKRGAARTILATNKKGRWIFLFGFQKNERENITPRELEALQELASKYLKFSDENIRLAIAEHKLLEVFYETEK